jgi:CubicO group peptidase (beta-lactamase class C family)
MVIAQKNYDFNALEQKIERDINAGLTPSIAVAIAKEGKIIYQKAFGYYDKELRLKASVNTSYQLASISKPITATGVMVLHRSGKININERAERYMTPLRFSSSQGSIPTIKQLLNHTSGLGTYFDISYADESRRPESFGRAFRHNGILMHQPGRVCEYSNLGYGLLDHIISKKSGKPFAEYMEEAVFAPLGMKHSFVQGSERKGYQIAKKYDSEGKVLPPIANNTPGAGNIFASVNDLIRFGMFHLGTGLPEQRRILSEKELELMHYFVDSNALYHYYDSAYYTLGWYYKASDNGYKILWHEGGMMGASSLLRLLPEQGIAVAVILNTYNREMCNEIASQLTQIVLPTYQATLLNEETEIAEYRPYTVDSLYQGTWQGKIKVDTAEIPCTLEFRDDGSILMTYQDDTYRSYFTGGNPLPHKTFLLAGIINGTAFIGMLPGNLPSTQLRKEYSQILVLKLIREGSRLSGSVTALAAAQREYYAYPFYMELEKK